MPDRLCFLLVDDNPADLLLAREVFDHHEQVDLMTRGSGADCLLYLRDPHSHKPDVVVLDLNMPGLSGFDVLKTMKDDPALMHIPVVILSTSGDPRDVTQAYSLHASSYMVKSVNFTEFMNQIQVFLDYWKGCRLR